MRRLCLLPVFLLAASLAFADWALQPEKDARPQHWITYALTFNGDFGIERNRALGAVGYQWNYEPFQLSAAVQESGPVSDLTLSALWWAVKSVHRWRTWSFGIESIYHYQHYDDVYGEHDAIFYINMRQKRDNGFELLLKQGATLKAATVYAAEETICNWNPSAWLSVSKTWHNGVELFSTVGSHSSFRYQLFFAPTFTVGAAVTLGGLFRPSLEWVLGCTDFFAASIYINTMALRLSGRIIL